MACFGLKDTEFYCHVVLLDESEFPVTVQKSSKGMEVLEKVFDHLNVIERDYFGLRYVDKAVHSRWLDPMKRVLKQLKSGPPYLLYLCVKFYAADPCCLHEELTRYLFYLQLKRDILQGRLPCSHNILIEISAYAIQSELGDFYNKQHTPGYVSEFRFIPKQTEELETKIADYHKKLIGLVPSVAEFMFLDKVKWLEMYGVDLHLVKGEDNIEYFVALKPAGVVVYHNKTPVGTYLWPKITKIDFKGKKFYLNVSGKEGREYVYVFYLTNKSACKHLWKCCVEHHTFFRLDRVRLPPQSNFSGLLRTGSGFRYSGRTQKEALEEGNRNKRSSPVVRRKPSRRYNRRESQSSVRGNMYSVSPVQVTNCLEPNQATISMKLNTDPSMTSGGTLYTLNTLDDSQGPALPWEELAQTQAGLYTAAQQSPRSIHSNGSTKKVRRRSPKFPSPHRRSGQSSGSETDTPRRRSRSRSAYYSDDDVGRRRRHHKRSHRHAYSGDSGSDSYALHRKSKSDHRAPMDIEEVAKLGDTAPYHWANVGQDRANQNARHVRHHDNERDVRSERSSRPRPSKDTNDRDEWSSLLDTMVPALDVIQPRVALKREAKELRHRHHRHHRHSHHGNPASESGQSTFSAPPASSTRLLLMSQEGTFAPQATPPRVQHMLEGSSIKRNTLNDNATSPKAILYGGPQPVRNGSNNTILRYPPMEVNGNITHHGGTSYKEYIEVVSGPPPYQQCNMNQYDQLQSLQSGKSTFL